MPPPKGLWKCERANRCERKSKPEKPSLHHPSTTFLQIPLKKRAGTVPWELTRTKSIELRSGTLHFGCECHKRNGLQDQCQRTICLENPSCTNYSKQLCELGRIMSTPREPKIEEECGQFHLKTTDDHWEIYEPQQSHHTETPCFPSHRCCLPEINPSTCEYCDSAVSITIKQIE